jgi:hypothetical protein
MGTIEANTLADANLLILAGAVVGLIIWILVSYFVDRAADRKNRSFTSFFLIAFFVLSPATLNDHDGDTFNNHRFVDMVSPSWSSWAA